MARNQADAVQAAREGVNRDLHTRVLLNQAGVDALNVVGRDFTALENFDLARFALSQDEDDNLDLSAAYEAATTTAIDADPRSTPATNSPEPKKASMLSRLMGFVTGGADKVGSAIKGAVSYVPLLNKLTVASETNDSKMDKTRNAIVSERMVGLATTAVCAYFAYTNRAALANVVPSFAKGSLSSMMEKLTGLANIIPGVNIGGGRG